jgi:methylated-DNA-[protein]-cysteine S-methyltransferase
VSSTAIATVTAIEHHERMNTDTAWATIPAPSGSVTVVASRKGLQRIAFGALAEYPGDAPHTSDNAEAVEVVANARQQLGEYFAGERETFDLPLDWSRSAGWALDVRRALYETVHHGDTISYGELAARAGRPDGARAVGGIMAGNPLPIVVPCHRVIAADGGIGGFAGSGGTMVETKRKLLELEGSAAPTLFDL